MVNATPSQFTEEPVTKSLPLIVRVTAVLPAATLEGESELTEGTGLTAVMVKATVFEVPPPGVGLTTVTFALPAVVRLEAGTIAVSCEALTYVVVNLAPSQLKVEPGTKSLPDTVNVKSPLPLAALVGDIDVIDGSGLSWGSL